ncbi:terpene cyclase/mutase family protein [Halalkalibacter hemicellulosilyticus]|uniref:Uncharacterized protein n=1 Tax=Halalkalibacter hemicellulosilyticusJCM 9152 TaxID=1236971 RepID=W4QEX4_9BACI|nr:terpene cyclase/mutase family protein [Halalkalibacter hemicellulosilyticus]GAE30655.1 hypothetical protein JCM9152_2069 [Halalkalibacter hemicellulosilyticusJCM 9152]
MSVMEKQLTEVLEQLDEQYSGLFKWLAHQYDPLSGGFYYARSSKESARFKPDIESTAQAINILIRNDALSFLPEEIKRKLIQFFQRKQVKETGYFLDNDPKMEKDEVMVQRALGYSVNALKRLGSEPLYPLPLKAKAAPAFTKSVEAYIEKWKSIDLSNSWRGCDLLATSCIYLQEMNEAERIPFVKAATDYLASIQDQQTGLWGDGSLYVRISGTFKLHTFYSKFYIPLPNRDKVYKSILTCLRTEKAIDMCYIRNPIDLLVYLDLDLTDEELVEIIQITTKNMSRLKRIDGGFSREIDHSPKAPNVAQVKEGEYYPHMPEPVFLGEGLVEGDMNASTQATLIRMQCYRLAKKKVLPLQETREFFKYVEAIL